MGKVATLMNSISLLLLWITVLCHFGEHDG